ncbi:MAG: AAA family ATPase, partial [Pseudomonadota bacterium]
RLCILDRSISEKTRIGGGYRQRPLETLTLTMAFGRVSEIQRWIDEGRVMCEEEGRIGPGLHVYRGDYWEALGDVPRRPLESVLCEDDRIERLLADLRWFQGARDWYAERGVPWRRGYLLYGPPGTGKSSLVRVIASELDLDIATLEIGRPGLGDDDLCEAMSKAPRRSLIAMEDIDALFVGRETGEKRVGVSFSGLLNAIDGVAAQEGRPVFMTTNHRERLDPALIRPGRADVHVELGPVGAEVAARLFARFFPERPDLAARFRLALDGCRVTPAALQGWLLEHLADPEHAAGAAGLVGGARLAAE